MSKASLVELQHQIAARLDSFVSNYNKTPKERFTLGYLTARSEGLHAIWVDFCANHDQICMVLGDDDPAINEYEKDTFEEYEALYYAVAGRICDKRRELEPPPPPPAAVPAPAQPPAAVPVPAPAFAPGYAPVLPAAVPAAAPDLPANPFGMQQPAAVLAHHIQITRLNVPPFNGTYDDWPSFRDLFVAAVHTNPTLLPVHKLQYLKTLLTGTAETVLKHLATTADNYVSHGRN